MSLRIHIVGDVSVSSGRAFVGQDDLHGPQGRLVLAMLVGEHVRPVRRDELAEELWPDHVPTSWDTAIRVIVSRLRAALAHVDRSPERLIGSTAGGYQLRLPPDGWIDLDEAGSTVHRAETALRDGSIGAAGADALVASMIAGRPFLAGMDGPWIETIRQRLLDLHLRALVCLAEVWFARGDHAQAWRDADAVIRLDPYREQAHRLLMRAHAAAGDRASAARAFRACRQRLAEDLGVRPSVETIELAVALGLTDQPPGDGGS